MSRKNPAQLIAFVGIMAAAAFVANFLSIPVGGSRIHLGNTIPLLAGMLFGGPIGALSAAIGSALFDIVYNFSDPASAFAIPSVLEAIVTFVNKGLMALACGVLVKDQSARLPKNQQVYLGAIAGAVLYIALFISKSAIYSHFFTPELFHLYVTPRLLTSSLNGAFAVLLAPMLYAFLQPALEKTGLNDAIPPKLMHWPQTKHA